MLEILSQPWPWYVAGPLIGLTVPALLILGNKSFGISSVLRHTCAACFPAGINFFKYDWKREIWNVVFVVGIFLGAVIAMAVLKDPNEIVVTEELRTELAAYGVNDYSSLVPKDLISWDTLFTLKGFFFMVVGGFLVGFGTRYAGGCTSGHAIMGLSTLQWPSLVATIFFMIGGFLSTFFIVPWLLSL
jgi:uncharacterized membrane protein YedE/YeeE